MANEILELTNEQVKELKDRLRVSNANLSHNERLELTIINHIDNVAHQVINNNENFVFIWSLFLRETTLGQIHIDRIKDQSIKKINAHDKAMKMYR